MADKDRGLYHKYDVFRADTGARVEDCFVLCPATDIFARLALEDYARYIWPGKLRTDILNWLEQFIEDEDGPPTEAPGPAQGE